MYCFGIEFTDFVVSCFVMLVSVVIVYSGVGDLRILLVLLATLILYCWFMFVFGYMF